MSQQTVTSTESMRSEWAAHHRLALWAIRRLLPDRRDDELRDQALFLAWEAFCRLSGKRPELSATLRVRFAVSRAVWRIKRDRSRVAKLSARQIDALDVSTSLACAFADTLLVERCLERMADRAPRSQPAEECRQDVREMVFRKLPAGPHRQAAALIGLGHSRREAARKMEISRDKLAGLLDDVAVILCAEIGTENVDDSDDDFPAIRFRPQPAEPVVAPIEFEPNLTRLPCDYPIAFPGK